MPTAKTPRCCFNSRTLGRVRQESVNPELASIEFQFTHPGKGATVIKALSNSAIVVSIHAPWEGCDSKTNNTEVTTYSFNSRTLGRVRRGKESEWLGVIEVSIHAPWEGCDPSPSYLYPHVTCFNSRTLGRVRLTLSTTSAASTLSFNSRTLGRVRLFRLEFESFCEVSIHAPWEGCDRNSYKYK